MASLAANAVPFAQIFNNILARVAAGIGVSVDFVRPVASDEYDVTELEDLFAYVRPYKPSPIDPTSGRPYGDYGAGRHARIVGRRFRVYVWTRSGVDTYGGDEIALGGEEATQTSLTPPAMPGQFVAEELLLNALDDYQPLNTAGTAALTVGPVHWVDDGGGPPARKPRNEEGLVYSFLDFQVAYVLAIAGQEPSP